MLRIPGEATLPYRAQLVKSPSFSELVKVEAWGTLKCRQQPQRQESGPDSDSGTSFVAMVQQSFAFQ